MTTLKNSRVILTVTTKVQRLCLCSF